MNMENCYSAFKHSHVLVIFYRSCEWVDRQFGNRAGHTWGTVGAQLGHKIVFPGAHLGHTWGTVGAQLGQKVTWGTLGAEAVGAQLGHTWGTVGAKK